MFIYIIENLITKKKYIGQTIRPVKQRWYEHIRQSKRTNESNTIHFDINFFGKKNFKFDIIEECDNTNDLNRLEKYYIEKYDTFNNGYNKTTGGQSFNLSIDCRIQMSRNSKYSKEVCVYDNSGKLLSNFSSANKAARELDINPKSIFRVLSGKRNRHKGLYFKWKDDLLNIEDKCKLKYNVPIYKYNLYGEFIEVYNSTKEASILNKIRISRINQIIEGVRSQENGFYYSLKENDQRCLIRKIALIDKDNRIISKYNNIKEAAIDNNIITSSIYKVLCGRRKSIYNKIFIYI